jgi:hypothetical protein
MAICSRPRPAQRVTHSLSIARLSSPYGSFQGGAQVPNCIHEFHMQGNVASLMSSLTGYSMLNNLVQLVTRLRCHLCTISIPKRFIHTVRDTPTSIGEGDYIEIEQNTVCAMCVNRGCLGLARRSLGWRVWYEDQSGQGMDRNDLLGCG